MAGSNTAMLESDDTSSMMSDDVEPVYLPRSRHDSHRFAPLPVDMAIYPAGKLDNPKELYRLALY